MGGGGVMRAAARVTGVGGVIHRGLRGPQPAPSGEHRVSASASSAAFPVSATLSSSSALIGAAESVFQRSIGDSDDWVFASGEGELNSGTDFPSPRLVFAGVPTLEEAKSATSDLKDALEKFAADHESDSDLKTSTTVTKKSLAPLLQNPAVQAFKLLQENSGAQTVVASLACDQHVWDAVLKNEALLDFLQSQRSDVEDGESVADSGLNGCGGSQRPKGGSGFCKFMENLKVSVVAMMNKASVENLKVSVENLKVSVVEMMNKASDLWRNTAAGLGGEEGFNAKDSSMPMTLMALVVAVIMLVLFKRV